MTFMTLPTQATSAFYKLLPAKRFYPTREKPVLGIVLHITAGLQDLGLVGDDDSAEGTIRWALSALPKVSWHAGSDSDGVELCIPDWFTAWHAAGVNSPTVGLEISKLNVDWSNVSAAWKERTLRWAAHYLAAIVVKHGLPLRLETSVTNVKAAIAAGRKFGFVYHSVTSAGTRSDPGKNFPIDTLFQYIREAIANEVLLPGFSGAAVVTLQKHLIAKGAKITADGSYGPATEGAVKAFQAQRAITVTGMAGSATLKALAPVVVAPKPTPTPNPTAPVVSKEINVLALVRVDGTNPVYKSDGFRRQHIGPRQRDGLLRSGLKITVLKDAVELDAYGVLEPNPAGQK